MILNRRPDATDGCSSLPKRFKGDGAQTKEKDLAWRDAPVEERLTHALVHGIDDTSKPTPKRRAARRPSRSKSSKAR